MPWPFLLPQGIEEELQAIDLDLMDSLQHPPQFAFREAFSGEPDYIGFRQVDQQPSRVFAEGHAHSGQFKQIIRIE